MGKFKGVTLACVALVALAVLGAGSASAAELKAETYPTTLKGVQVGEHAFKFENNAKELKCPTGTFEWEMTMARTVFALIPNYGKEEAGKCTFAGLAATVKRNGCIFDFHAETKITGDEFKGFMNITCTAGNAVTITAVNCEIQIGEQLKLAPVKFLNITLTPAERNHIRVNPEISKSFKYKVTKDGIGCPLAATGEFGDGTFEGVTTVLGENVNTLARHEIWLE